MADAEELGDELNYPQEDVERFVQDTAEEVLKDVTWDEQKVPHLIN